jgi:hypothetical protein
MNVGNDGVPNAPPYPPHHADGEKTTVDEGAPTQFVFQAKVEVNRNKNESHRFQLKSLLIALLVQYQRVDPTFHLLPTEEGSTKGAIAKAQDIPNTEKGMKAYVKEMHEIDRQYSSSYYTIVFFLKVASSKTLGMMKKDKRLFDWLKEHKLFIRSFQFTTTYDVANAGFISNMHGGIHNRDKMNEIIQEAMKRMFPTIEVKLVPTALRYGNDSNRRTTQVVSIQSDRKQLNESREALIQVFHHHAEQLPHDVFFVPSPTNGMMSTDMYYDLVRAHDVSMSNIRSFAITGIANLQAKLTIQSTTNPESTNQETIENVIMGAKLNGTDTNLFTSIEPTSRSQSEGRYLLLTNKHHIGQAEFAIDSLIEHIRANPDIKKETNIEGMEIKRANKYDGSSYHTSHLSFLEKIRNTAAKQDGNNAWNKRRAPTPPTHFSHDEYPALPNPKSARTEQSGQSFSTTECESTEMDDTIIIDFEAEMDKERDRVKTLMDEMKREMYEEMQVLKTQIDSSEKRMMEQMRENMSVMKDNMSEMIKCNNEFTAKMETVAEYRAEQMFELVSSLRQPHQQETTTKSPPRKQPRNHGDDTIMDEVTHPPTTNPASPQNLFHTGKDARASEPK